MDNQATLARSIEPSEALEILNNFIPLAVNGEIDQETRDLMESTIKEIASGKDIYIQTGPLLDFIKTFFACFDFNDEEGTYRFQRGNYIMTGETGYENMRIPQ